MSLIVGGIVAAILGLVGLIEWRGDFIVIIEGALPLIFLLGGILAVYVGVDDYQEKIREEKERQKGELDKAREEIELLKTITETNREELNRLREKTGRQE